MNENIHGKVIEITDNMTAAKIAFHLIGTGFVFKLRTGPDQAATFYISMPGEPVNVRDFLREVLDGKGWDTVSVRRALTSELKHF